MTKEISKKLKCIVMRNSVEIWKEEERINDLIQGLVSGKKVGFIKIDDEIINSVDIVGIFTAQTMEDLTRRKNGQWQKDGKWYNKGDRVCKCGNIIPYGKQCGFC